VYSYEHDGDRQFATTLARGLEVLRCFTPLEPMLGNKEISVRTGLPKPTVSRLTYTLTKLGLPAPQHPPREVPARLGGALDRLPAARVDERAPDRAAVHQGACRTIAAERSRWACATGLSMVYVESCRSGNGIAALPDIGTSVPIAQAAIGRAYLAVCTPPEREALLNQMKVKEPDMLRKYKPQIDKALDDVRARGFCVSLGELRREVHAVGVPMRRTVDGEVVAFNCGVPAFMLKKGQIEDDIGPRLVAMVRNIEGALGIH
jgi:DNA-binding IclR family transcriptional regulator